MRQEKHTEIAEKLKHSEYKVSDFSKNFAALLGVEKTGGVLVRVLKNRIVHRALIADFHSGVHINTQAFNEVLADVNNRRNNQTENNRA